LDGTDTVTWFAGNVYAMIPGSPGTRLFGFEGFNVSRAVEADGGWDLLTREAAFYMDGGAPLERWTNPFTGSDVDVVHVWNDPVNFRFRYPVPFTEAGDTIVFNADVFLAYPSPLPRAQFPDNSQDDLYQAAELFQFYCSRADLEGDAPSVPALISWTRIAPWLPWMCMSDRPGQLVYHCRGAKLNGGFAALPSHIRESVEAHGLRFASAPAEFTEPNETSWTYFKKLVTRA
jgi:hypothetical protein